MVLEITLSEQNSLCVMILVRREHQIHSLECITFMMAAFDFLQETKPIVGGVAWLRCQRLILCMIFCMYSVQSEIL